MLTQTHTAIMWDISLDTNTRQNATGAATYTEDKNSQKITYSYKNQNMQPMAKKKKKKKKKKQTGFGLQQILNFSANWKNQNKPGQMTLQVHNRRC